MHGDVDIEEPCYVFLTAFMTQTFRSHLESCGVRHVYEKPAQIELLRSVLLQEV